MGKIALLSENLINQIAAGEVVERPASVVKELLENSIDAGAKRIVVTVRQGGIGLLRVADDGCGMSSDDALKSLERHATSKIRTLDDLQAVRTMGFRGEALASIASVSRLTLSTRQAKDAHGLRLFLEGGKLLQQSPVGCSVGTEIEVAGLFFNTLPRLKFLKSEQTEYQNVLDTVIAAAMVNPGIAFKVILEQVAGENPQENEAALRPGGEGATGGIYNVGGGGHVNAKIALDLPATEEPLVRIRGLLGQNIAQDLLEVFYGGVALSIRGFIGKPQLSRANRSMQYFFVNGRPINSHVLSYAVKQAYHALLPKERFPVFVVFFELDPSMVDVNCHPRKTEVKFRDEREVYRVLLMACGKALEKAILTPKVTENSFNYYQEKKVEGLGRLGLEMTAGKVESSKVEAMGGEAVGLAMREMAVPVGGVMGAKTMEGETYALNFGNRGEPGFSTHGETMGAAGHGQSGDFLQQPVDDAGGLLPLGQLDNSFILCQKGHDLVIIDQHAAHERIRYNKLMSEAESDEKAVQPLLMPFTFDCSPAEIAVLDGNKALLEELGIGLEHFGGATFAINEVPAYLVKTDLEKVLRGLIDDMKNLNQHGGGAHQEFTDHKGDLFGRKEKALTYLACRSAVKFGDPLDMTEIRALIDQLNNLPSGQMTCPHGRPIMLVMERAELWSRFGRKYTGFFEQENFRDVNC